MNKHAGRMKSHIAQIRTHKQPYYRTIDIGHNATRSMLNQAFIKLSQNKLDSKQSLAHNRTRENYKHSKAMSMETA